MAANVPRGNRPRMGSNPIPGVLGILRATQATQANPPHAATISVHAASATHDAR